MKNTAADWVDRLEEHLPLPTVRELLDLEELQAGLPEVVAGGEALDAPVRWAHIVAGRDAADLLDGGELVLTTGAGWPTSGTQLERLARSLVEVGVAAIVLELGDPFPEPPAALLEACSQRGVPLIVLHRVVRFVQVTERVHRRILAAQSEALQARVAVHRMLTELGLNRSPVDFVVEQIAATIDAPVVLENTAGDVVAWSAPGPMDAETVLARWARASRPGTGGTYTTDINAGDAIEQVSVEARGTRWGALTALAGPPHPAGRRTVLELGAFALALGRLSEVGEDQWIRHTSKRLIDSLLSGKYRRDVDLATQLTASGLPVTDRTLVAVSLTGVGEFGSHRSLERAVLETALRRTVAPDGRTIITDLSSDADREPLPEVELLALVSLPIGDSRLDSSAVSQQQAGDAPPFAARLARELNMLVPDTTHSTWRAHLSLGVPGAGVRGIVASVEGVRAVGRVSPSSSVGLVTVQEAERQPLAYLLRGFSTAPVLQEFVQRELGPIIEHDRASGPGHTGDLLDVLAVYLAHPTNRSLAAEAARLSRSVFYQRLALIEELLGVDLADGHTIATLAVALTAYRT